MISGMLVITWVNGFSCPHCNKNISTYFGMFHNPPDLITGLQYLILCGVSICGQNIQGSKFLSVLIGHVKSNRFARSKIVGHFLILEHTYGKDPI